VTTDGVFAASLANVVSGNDKAKGMTAAPIATLIFDFWFFIIFTFLNLRFSRYNFIG
jgi:Zn-dependent protease with chaperone function